MAGQRRSNGGSSTRRVALGLCVVLAGSALAASAQVSAPRRASLATGAEPGADGRTKTFHTELPLSFEPNVGQAEPAVGFVSRGPGHGLRLAPTEAVLGLGDAALWLTFAGADPTARPVGRVELPGRVNYLVGESSQWRSDVPTYARVGFEGLYEGVDIAYYGTDGGLEYDLQVAPGADPQQVRLVFGGSNPARIDDDGHLVLELPGGEAVQQRAPVAFQYDGDRRQPVRAGYVVTESGAVVFGLGDYDHSRPLIIDPVLTYSTYLGGSSQDSPNGVAVDASGNAYLVGTTWSSNYPTQAPMQPPGGDVDVVVSKLSPSGSALVYSTYLGGSGADWGGGIALDGTGAVYLTGRTASPNFPAAAAPQPTKGAGEDAFVAKLNPTGSALVYSTYLGGAGQDGGADIAVDGTGNAYVTGTTDSTDFPTRLPLQASNGGEDDAFVAKLNASGTALVYSTYLGGSSEDYGAGVDVDPSGAVELAGSSESSNFPTLNAVQGALHGYVDAFVARLNSAGSALVYSTYLGGMENSLYLREYASAVGTDAAGSAYVTGLTTAGDFPTFNPLYPNSGNGYDAFVTKLSPSGSFAYSTYLGSDGSESAADIAVDTSGNAYITGNVFGSVPVKDPVQGVNAGNHDAFVTVFNPSGSALVYSTFLGGSGNDHGWAIAVDGSGAAYVAGDTESDNLPTRGAIQPARRGGYDTFFTKLGAGQAAPTIQGTTWYAGGTSAKSGFAGSSVSLYATGAAGRTAYRLVISTTQNCADTVAVLNATPRMPNNGGFIGATSARLPTGIPPGTYYLCFKDEGSTRATASAQFTVVSPPSIEGRTFVNNGVCCLTGPPGLSVTAYATGARVGTSYQLVLTTTEPLCANTVAVLNPQARLANGSGYIAKTTGTVPAGVPPGDYHVCFKDAAQTTATSPDLVRVTAS